MSTVTVCIGNSDDGLPQAKWASFWTDTDQTVRSLAEHVHGEFASLAVRPWQNAAWVIECDRVRVDRLCAELAVLARRYGQDSIAVVVGETRLVTPEEVAGGRT